MLKNILKIVSLRGQREITEVIIDNNKILATSPDQTIALRLITKESILGSKEPIGLQHLPALKQYFEMIPEADVTIKDNRLTIKKNKKKISVLLKDPQFVNSKVEEKNFDNLSNALKSAISIKIDLSKLHIIDNYLSTTEAGFFNLQLKDKELTISIIEENKDNIKDVIEVESKGEASVKLGSSFVDAISVLEGEAELLLKDNSPIFIKQKNKEYSIEMLIAEVD